MKRKLLHLIMLLCISVQVFAHDFEAVNSDGKTIYYRIAYYNGVEVSYRGYSSTSYTGEYYGVLNIPETVTYNGVEYTVLSIDNYAFSGCTGISSVTIPNTVTHIGAETFKDCLGLTDITIGNSVSSIGQYAFSGCISLTDITIPNSVTSIGEYAFKDCSNLTTITIGEGVTSIAQHSFDSCSNLTSIIYNAENCETIGNSLYPVFKDCHNLTSLTIGNSVNIIPDYAFYGCKSLTNIYIPNASIGKYSFCNCSSLNSVTIGDGSNSIADWAFINCYDIRTLVLGSNITSIGNNAFPNIDPDTIRIDAVNPPNITISSFENVRENVPIIVPCGSLEVYQNARFWRKFMNFIDECNSGLDEFAEETGIAIYPNPVMDNAVLSIDNLKEDVKVILTDEQGRQVSLSTMKAGEREINLNTNSLSNGIYFVRIVGETILRTEKIIKK